MRGSPAGFTAAGLASSLRALQRLAEREATSALDQLAAVERHLEADAKRALFALALAERSLAVNQELRLLLDAMVAAVAAKYRVGKATQASLLRAQAELLGAESERLDLERGCDEARARLNALVDRDAAAPLPPLALPAPPAGVPTRGGPAPRRGSPRAGDVTSAYINDRPMHFSAPRQAAPRSIGRRLTSPTAIPR